MSDTTVTMSSQTQLARKVALVGFIGLFVWVAVWHIALTEPRTYSIAFIVLIYLLPLMLPAIGIIKGKPYTHAWASFIVLLYLMHGITVWYATPNLWLYACIEIVLSLLMFAGCSYFARLRGKELGQTLPKLKTVMDAEKERFEGVKHEKDSSN